jgi:hypothetical protein
MGALVISALLVGLVAGTALAAKGDVKGGGGGPSKGASSVSLVLLDSTDGRAHWGDRVTFNVSTTATDRPFVGLRCYQGSSFVLDSYVGLFATYMYDPWVTLGSPYWNPLLEASCTARLFYYDGRGNQKVLATTSFAAYP